MGQIHIIRGSKAIQIPLCVCKGKPCGRNCIYSCGVRCEIFQCIIARHVCHLMPGHINLIVFLNTGIHRSFKCRCRGRGCRRIGYIFRLYITCISIGRGHMRPVLNHIQKCHLRTLGHTGKDATLYSSPVAYNRILIGSNHLAVSPLGMDSHTIRFIKHRIIHLSVLLDKLERHKCLIPVLFQNHIIHRLCLSIHRIFRCIR